MTDARTPDSSSTRLLILDDDPMIGATIKRIAEFDGHAVVYTEHASEFFQQVDSWDPNIIALDLIMPDMNGVEVMEQLVKRGCRAALIVSSGVGDRVLDAARRSARENGLNVVGVLPKPFSAKTLREMLRKAGDLRHSSAPSANQGVKAVKPIPTARELQQAMDAGQIRVALQPKARCRSGTLAGFEALARWHHPELGAIPPDIFIPVAENAGLIDRLTLQIAAQALRWLAGLPEQVGSDHRHDPVLDQIQLSLNVSARTLTNRALFDELAALCRQNRIPLERIILELTETSAMEDAAVSLNTLTHLRLQGFSLSIDDFGTGYSSMVQLVRMPFSEIKIDKSFVSTAMTSSESRAVVRSVVDLGRSLGLETTAEGVEDEETLSYLKSLGCDIAQGYLVSRPLFPEDVGRWYSERREAMEAKRLASLHSLHLLDTPPEERFDRITRLAADAFSVSTALISLVDSDRQWFKSRVNNAGESTPRRIAFCNRTIENDNIMVIPDTTLDPVFRLYPQVCEDPPLRFYAGRPLFLDDGSKIGTLCLIDNQRRDFFDADTALLDTLGEMVEDELRGGLQQHLNAVTHLPDSAAFHVYAERALDISHRFNLPVSMISIELTMDVDQIENDELGNVRRRYVALARFAEENSHEAFLVGHYQGYKIGLLHIGRKLKPSQALCEQLRAELREYNANRTGDSESINAAITVGSLVDYLGALTH